LLPVRGALPPGGRPQVAYVGRQPGEKRLLRIPVRQDSLCKPGLMWHCSWCREQNRTRKGTMGEFTFQGQGTLQRIDTFTSKAGKTILTLICETQGQYPQLVPIKVYTSSRSTVYMSRDPTACRSSERLVA
jgi:hypothetical protein